MRKSIPTKLLFSLFSFHLPNPSSLNIFLAWAAGTYNWQPQRRLLADCLENVGASTSNNPVGLHGLLRGYFYFFILLWLELQSLGRPARIQSVYRLGHPGSYSVALVRERTIPTELTLLVDEASAKFCWCRVSRGQRDGSLRPYSRLSRPEPLRLFQIAPQLASRGWVDLVPDTLLLRKSGSAGNRTQASGSVARNSDD
jgi:hypothetical protein